METTIATVKNVRVFVNEDSASVTLTLDKTVKGYKRVDGQFVETTVDSVSFPRSALTAMLCDANDDIALYRATRGQAFDQKAFGIILFNAKIKLNREFKAAGELVGEKAVERDCYISSVASVELSDRAIRALDAAIAL